MRTGRRVAFDIGKARIGVAVSDIHGILASPRDFVSRSIEQAASIDLLLEILMNETPIEIYIGLPINLRNEATESTKDALTMALALQSKTQTSVRLIDERMSTRLASAAMSSSGKSTRQQRGSIDSASAAVILETALQFEKSTGQVPGELVSEYTHEK